MKPLLANLILALVWLGITGDFALGNFLLGFILGFAVLAVASGVLGTREYRRRVLAAVALVFVFAGELAVANARVARDVLTTKLRAHPALVRVDLEASGDVELLVLSMLVTLTPGSVVVHVPADRSHMYVYGMYARDPRAFAKRIKIVFERRVLAVTRPEERK